MRTNGVQNAVIMQTELRFSVISHRAGVQVCGCTPPYCARSRFWRCCSSDRVIISKIKTCGAFPSDDGMTKPIYSVHSKLRERKSTHSRMVCYAPLIRYHVQATLECAAHFETHMGQASYTKFTQVLRHTSSRGRSGNRGIRKVRMSKDKS